MVVLEPINVEPVAQIPTWFRVGGGADALAAPASSEQVVALIEQWRGGPIRVLGDGANLLVDDAGVDGLVLDLRRLDDVDFAPGTAGQTCIVRARAGANLPKLITESVRRGLAGLEGLAGIPASVGGAVMMNAGGAFGEIASSVVAVRGVDLQGRPVSLTRSEIPFAYRHSGLKNVVVTEVDFALAVVPEDQRPALRERLKEVMAYKARTQPMADNSAGCFWKNPGDLHDATKRTSAGKLIDECGLKGAKVGGAMVSPRHANFVVTEPGCTARDILELMGQVRRRVHASAGIWLTPEVVVWSRDQAEDVLGGRP
jgi:UDP-N-acetylmuramate dehydrogenase